jgi:hypothetical protein
MDNDMVGVLRETSIRGRVPPCPPLPYLMNSSVVVGNARVDWRPSARLKSSTPYLPSKLPGSPFSSTGNRYKIIFNKSENNPLQCTKSVI